MAIFNSYVSLSEGTCQICWIRALKGVIRMTLPTPIRLGNFRMNRMTEQIGDEQDVTTQWPSGWWFGTFFFVFPWGFSTTSHQWAPHHHETNQKPSNAFDAPVERPTTWPRPKADCQHCGQIFFGRWVWLCRNNLNRAGKKRMSWVSKWRRITLGDTRP